MGRIYYRIAQLDIKLDLNHLEPMYLFNFIPFRINEEQISELLFIISNEQFYLVADCPTRQYKTDQFIVSIYLLKKECYVKVYSEITGKEYLFRSDYQWANIKTDLQFIEKEEYEVLSHALMFFYIYSSSFHNTLMIKASSIRIKETGIAFIDETKAKNKHSELWINHIENSIQISEDLVIMKISKLNTYIYSTPWSEKKVVNEKARLQSLYILENSTDNEIIKISAFTAFRELLTSCFMMQEDKETFNCIIKTLVTIVESIQVYILKNKSGTEAAKLAYSFAKQTIV